MARALPRLVVLFSALGVAHLSFVGCGGSDEVKHAMDEGGAGGEGGAATAGGSAGPAAGGTGGAAGDDGAMGGAGGAAPAMGAGAGGRTETGGAGGWPETGGAAGAAGASGAGGEGEIPCDAPPVGSRITIAVDASNAERVTNLQWLDNANAITANLAASGGPQTCGDPAEFFGVSYGVPEGGTPNVVIAGSRSTATTCTRNLTITSALNDCAGQPQIPVLTEYQFYGGAQASQLRVTRTIAFNPSSPQYTGIGVRPWQPRVPLAVLPKVVYPNDSDAMTTVDATACPGDCVTPVGPAWNGKWFADLGANGLAMIVRRDPSMTSAVSLTVNWDSYSTANIASFVVLQPQGGWKAPIIEIEYVCFADFVSWPQAQRDLAQLPDWCGP
jgi:hypothetical protein